ncbi:TetR/AcrR family transcriptional regulator [Bosea sp. BIWAKO-01]|uniref:TetR/AcrR family transcriptional regulator n=1 Tax=Bosea sp. BIWAKO-01 TaxID=506668 RepID=UPI0008538977|nr:TetR/AcrR family transcriptional regulator [Bosea sp. BIWAKO-01]GAU86192.1 hypothetical protein BIWAKO_06140 [Bosea sp. BIWAKO-01]
MKKPAEDRRNQIVEAGLALLAEEGLPGLTQPKIAARTGLRQSHLTYYYPTRTSLVTTVARAAFDAQAEAARAVIARISSVGEAAAAIAAVTGRHERTRVLVALNQASEREPEVRQLFNDLTKILHSEFAGLLMKLGLPATDTDVEMLHALFIGLSVFDLATCRPGQQERSRAILDLLFSRPTSQALFKTAASQGRPGRHQTQSEF